MIAAPLLALTAIATWSLSPPTGTSADSRDGGRVSISPRAADWLQQMQRAYQSVSSYSDRTQMEFRGRRGDAWFEDRAELDVRYQRPDQLAVRAAHGRRMYHLAVDRGQLIARIDDPLADDFDGQVVRQPMTSPPTVAAILAAFEVANPEQAAAPRPSAVGTLPAPLGAGPLQFLLQADAVTELLQADEQVDILPPTTLRNRSVHRVRFATAQGPLILWIDADDFLLRRIEFPVGLNPDANATLVAEFTDIETNRPNDGSSFRFSVPTNTRWVRHFVVPPMVRENQQLGQRIDSLRFTDVWDQEVTEDRWRDRIAVLVWFSRHPSSRGVLSELEQLITTFDDANECFFLAVCTEPTTAMSHSDVVRLARDWQISMPVARDLDAVGRDVLAIDEAPTIAILDRRQRLQLLEAGGDSELNTELAAILKKLLANEDVSATYREVVAEQQRHYRTALQQASW